MAILLAGLALVAMLVLPQLLDRDLLFDGAEGYIFDTGSLSSNAEMTFAQGEEASRVRFFLGGVTAESARYARAEEAFAQADKYGAVLLFCERAADVTNYYYYSPRLCGGVEIGGALVNLHIAVRGGGASVGSPLIFGGY